jgi:hypothetical protein
VRLLGLSSRGWPQQATEDRLLPDHLVPTSELDPLPVSAADRRDFATILATSAREVALSRPRRDGEGRLLGRSPLLYPYPSETYLRRNRIPPHAMSEPDRLLARPEEFEQTERGRAALACWRNWHRPELTANDGLLRKDHPAVQTILRKRHSATSLQKLLRDPAGFVWKYGLGLRAPEHADEPLMLDASAYGGFLHAVLEQTVTTLESSTGLSRADPDAIRRAVDEILRGAKRSWEEAQPTPPPVIWKRTVADVAEVTAAALSYPDVPLPGQRSYVEVPFGGLEPRREAASLPWDPLKPVTIPGTPILVAGFIDRLDLAGDGSVARVRDYKSGSPLKPKAILNKGRELQRCLYAFAVKSLLGPRVSIEASLLFPRDEVCLVLPEPDSVLDELVRHLNAALASLLAGRALPGPDAESEWNDLAFALPANADKAYCKRKQFRVKEALGDAALVWEAE